MKCMWVPEEGIRSPGTGAPDPCEPPWGCWEWDPGPMEEQPVLLLLNHLSSPVKGFFFKMDTSQHKILRTAPDRTGGTQMPNLTLTEEETGRK